MIRLLLESLMLVGLICIGWLGAKVIEEIIDRKEAKNNEKTQKSE